MTTTKLPSISHIHVFKIKKSNRRHQKSIIRTFHKRYAQTTTAKPAQKAAPNPQTEQDKAGIMQNNSASNDSMSTTAQSSPDTTPDRQYRCQASLTTKALDDSIDPRLCVADIVSEVTNPTDCHLALPHIASPLSIAGVHSSSPFTRPPLPIRHRLELDLPASTPHALHTPGLQPPAEVLALTDIKFFDISTPFNHTFDTLTSHAYAPTHRKIAELQQM